LTSKDVSTLLPEHKYLTSLLPQEEHGNIKITLPSPSWYHLRYGPGKAYVKGVYENDEGYFKDIAKAFQIELGLLYDQGVRNVQVDDPNLACEFSDRFPFSLVLDRLPWRRN
jgi:methionine synthase II (cobalamin-independent)